MSSARRRQGHLRGIDRFEPNVGEIMVELAPAETRPFYALPSHDGQNRRVNAMNH